MAQAYTQMQSHYCGARSYKFEKMASRDQTYKREMLKRKKKSNRVSA